MPIGSHKDAFKAHQLVKRAAVKDAPSVLVRLAAEVLLDFVKSQRQVNARTFPDELPEDSENYDCEKLTEALESVDGLCGKCEESHSDSCFINQARRSLIAALTKVDVGSSYDGKASLADLILNAQCIAGDRVTEERSAGGGQAPAVANDNGDTQDLQAAFDALHEKDVFRATLIDEVVDTIRSVSGGNFATEMPVHDDEQLGKLATAFNLMLGVINETMAGLDRLVAERNAELKQLMNTVPVGLMTLNDTLRINAEYSKSAETILQAHDLRGRDFLDVIGITKRRSDERAKMADFFDVLRMGVMSADDLAELNPAHELELSGREHDGNRWIRTRYYPLEAGQDGAPNILALLEDITQEKRLAAEVVESQRTNSRLMAIAEDPDLFREFLRETRHILASVRDTLAKLHDAKDSKPLVNEAFRGVHTIKGGAGSFGLEDLSQCAGKLEDQLNKARESGTIETPVLEDVEAGLNELASTMDAASALAKKILGDDSDGDDIVLRIPLRAVKHVQQTLSQGALGDAARAELVASLARMQEVPAKRAFAKTLKVVPSLIQRLGKQIAFSFEGENQPVNVELAHEISTALLHLIRNSFDHGIEDADERLGTDKPPVGSVTLTVRTDDSNLEITVADDGRGLDPAKLKATAVRKNLLSEAEADALQVEDCYKLIFRPGFSTADVVSDVSGRGVGMDAVVGAIEEKLGGSVCIESKLGAGTRFTLRVPIP